jgi:hypothetical protein
MSNDIVDVLRGIVALENELIGSFVPKVCAEAADEIERLRASLTGMQSERDMWEREARRG